MLTLSNVKTLVDALVTEYGGASGCKVEGEVIDSKGVSHKVVAELNSIQIEHTEGSSTKFVFSSNDNQEA